MGTIIIVGAGHCGGRAALALREVGWGGEVVLIGDEADAPYERPPLSKGVLLGEVFGGTLAPAAKYAEAGVRWLAGRRVGAIDRAARELALDDGSTLRYDALLLATGGRPRALPIPGGDLPGVFTLRQLGDAAALAPRLVPGARVAVVGGGFIGLEVAASARARGAEVALVEAAPRLMGRAVPATLAERARALHESHGVTVSTGIAPRAVERTATGLMLSLADGRSVAVDTIVVGIGIAPDVALAQAAGLDCGNGITVDHRLRTSDPNIFAAGDVASFPSPRSGRPLRLESWHNAEDHARVAAANLAGGDARVTSWPWFWSDQYDHQLQIAGDLSLAAATVARAPTPNATIEFHLDPSGALAGVAGFGPTSELAKEFKIARTLLERGARVDPELLGDPSVKLKSLLQAS
jgi:3-phenylpropionate/trans-cinnamate dioxygenase ferredoxin reductase subunit